MASPFLSGLEKAGGVVATPFRAAERGVTQLGQGLNTALFDPKQGMISSFPGAQAAGSFISRQGGNLLSSMEPYPKGAPGGALGTLDPRTRQGQLTYAGLLASALMEGSRSGRLGRIGGYNDAEMNQAAHNLAADPRWNPLTSSERANLMGAMGEGNRVPTRYAGQPGGMSPEFQRAFMAHANRVPARTQGFKVGLTPMVQAYLDQLGGKARTNLPLIDYAADPHVSRAMSRMGYTGGDPFTDLLRTVPPGTNLAEYLGFGPGGKNYGWSGGNPDRINPLLSEFLQRLQPYRQN